ncbi:hypothetical protein [Streptomyces griseiscabiei]|uniref:Uncharacterized protein n=1 Tax=Streptomyces griseiscabiei TaxID=2993540 RepID=A0ABU4L5U9_9ACTN|nr:hypothetical protein [Streptomyces griseiscabiei]MDX2910478.1 hypothetical protein [Streptomyces griseiscabiei]
MPTTRTASSPGRCSERSQPSGSCPGPRPLPLFFQRHTARQQLQQAGMVDLQQYRQIVRTVFQIIDAALEFTRHSALAQRPQPGDQRTQLRL